MPTFVWIAIAITLKWTASSAQLTSGCIPPDVGAAARTVCSGGGECVDNRCLCVPPKTGTFCQETCAVGQSHRMHSIR